MRTDRTNEGSAYRKTAKPSNRSYAIRISQISDATRGYPTLSDAVRLYPTLSDAIRRPGRRLDAFWRVTIAIRWLSDGDPLWLSNDYIRQLSNGPVCAIGPIVSCSDSAQWKSYTKMYQNVTVNPNPCACRDRYMTGRVQWVGSFAPENKKYTRKNLRASYTTNIWSGKDSLGVVVVLYGSFHVEQTQHCIKRRIYIPLQILARQMFYYVPCGFVKSFWHPLGSLG